MTVTLDIDKTILKRAREVAEEYGMSLEAMIVQFVHALALDKMTPTEIAEDLRRQWAARSGHSDGRRWTREEMHERKNVR